MKKLFFILSAVFIASACAIFGGCFNGCFNMPADKSNQPDAVVPDKPDQPDDNEPSGDSVKNFTGVTFENKTVTYDGTKQTLTVSGRLPDGTEVKYTDNEGVNAGKYNATVVLKKDGYNDLTLQAVLTINKAKFTGVTFNDKSFFADGSEKTITVSGELPQDTLVEYTDNKGSAVGEYYARAEITNPNYETLVLIAVLKVKSSLQTAKSIVDVLLTRHDAWELLPEGLRRERMAYSAAPVGDFTTFVNASEIGKKFVGKQLHVLYEGIETLTTAFEYVERFYSVATTIADVYQKFISDNPDDYAVFTGEVAGYKIKIVLRDDIYEILLGNSTVNAELRYDTTRGANYGRIQITDGAVVKYEISANSLEFAAKATFKGVGNLKKISFVRNGSAVTGSLQEFTGTQTKNLKTSATLAFNAEKTIIMSNKRETDDLIINGYEEVYNSRTGEYIGGEVKEIVKDVEFDTLWFKLNDVSGINTIKAIHEANGINLDTIYINGSETAIKTKTVGGISAKTASRRFDIEMKDVYYIVKIETDGKVKYDYVKTSVPMLFVQRAQTGSFSADFNEKNNVSASIPSYTLVTEDYAWLQQKFFEIRRSVTYEQIDAYIGEKNSYFN